MLKTVFMVLALSSTSAMAVTGDYEHTDPGKSAIGFTDSHLHLDRANLLRALRNGEMVNLRVQSYADLILDPAGRRMVVKYIDQFGVIEPKTTQIVKPFLFKGIPLLSRQIEVPFLDIKRSIKRLQLNDGMTHSESVDMKLADALIMLKSVMKPETVPASQTFKMGAITLAGISTTQDTFDFLGMRSEQHNLFQEWSSLPIHGIISLSEVFFWFGGSVDYDLPFEHCGIDSHQIAKTLSVIDKRLTHVTVKDDHYRYIDKRFGVDLIDIFGPINNYYKANCMQIQLNRKQYEVKANYVNDLQSAINGSKDLLVTLTLENYLKLADLIDYNELRVLLPNLALDLGDGQGSFLLNQFSQIETEGLTPKVSGELVFEYLSNPFWAVNMARLSFSDLDPVRYYLGSAILFHPRDPVVEALGLPITGAQSSTPKGGSWSFRSNPRREFSDAAMSNTASGLYANGVSMLRALGVRVPEGSSLFFCSYERADKDQYPIRFYVSPVEEVVIKLGDKTSRLIPNGERHLNRYSDIDRFGDMYVIHPLGYAVTELRLAGFKVNLTSCELKGQN